MLFIFKKPTRQILWYHVLRRLFWASVIVDRLDESRLPGGTHTELLLVIDFFIRDNIQGVEICRWTGMVEVVMYEMWGREREKGRMDCWHCGYWQVEGGDGGRLSGDVALTVPLASTATPAAPGSVVVVDDISVDTCAAIPTTIAASTATATTENTNNSLPQYLSEKKLSVIRKTSYTHYGI